MLSNKEHPFFQFRGPILPTSEFFIYKEKTINTEYSPLSTTPFILSQGPFNYETDKLGMCRYYFTTSQLNKVRKEISLLLRPFDKNLEIDTLYVGAKYSTRLSFTHTGEEYVFIPKVFYYHDDITVQEYTIDNLDTFLSFAEERNNIIKLNNPNGKFYMYSSKEECTVFMNKGYSYCDMTESCGQNHGSVPMFMLGSKCIINQNKRTNSDNNFIPAYTEKVTDQSKKLAGSIMNQTNNAVNLWYTICIILIVLLVLMLFYMVFKKYFSTDNDWFYLPSKADIKTDKTMVIT